MTDEPPAPVRPVFREGKRSRRIGRVTVAQILTGVVSLLLGTLGAFSGVMLTEVPRANRRATAALEIAEINAQAALEDIRRDYANGLAMQAIVTTMEHAGMLHPGQVRLAVAEDASALTERLRAAAERSAIDSGHAAADAPSR